MNELKKIRIRQQLENVIEAIDIDYGVLEVKYKRVDSAMKGIKLVLDPEVKNKAVRGFQIMEVLKDVQLLVYDEELEKTNMRRTINRLINLLDKNNIEY